MSEAAVPLHADLAWDASAAELVDAIRSLEDLVNRARAEQARLTARLAALRPDDAAGLVGFARRESPARAAQHVGLAAALTTELPHTSQAMEAGDLSEWHATLIARETACLDRDERALVDELVAAARPDGRRRFEGWGDRRLSAEARRIVADLDSAAGGDRRAPAA